MRRNAFGAELMERFAEPDGRVGYAKLTLGDFPLSLSDETPEIGVDFSHFFERLSVLLELEDGDTVAEKMVAEKAEVVIPIKDRPYGKREGRIRDPVRHLCILSEQVAR